MVTIPSTPNGVTITHQLAHALAGGTAAINQRRSAGSLRVQSSRHAVVEKCIIPSSCDEGIGNQPKTLSRKPAAMAEPMTPATLGPMACISRKLEGLAFWP